MSDYSDGDFQDLMSVKQIQQSIKVFYDRLRELINPIDEDRLKLDSVHQVKNTVYNFYKKKNQQSKLLLQELDKMTSERFKILDLKKKYFNAEESSVN